jgi:hypothetical protein
MLLIELRRAGVAGRRAAALTRTRGGGASRRARDAAQGTRGLDHSWGPDASAGRMLGVVQIRKLSGGGPEQIARESFVPVLFRTVPDFRGWIALEEMGKAVTLSRAYLGGPHRLPRTDRMVAKTPRDDMMLFIVNVAGAH